MLIWLCCRYWINIFRNLNFKRKKRRKNWINLLARYCASESIMLFGKTRANVLRSALRYNVYSFAYTYAQAHSNLIANCFFFRSLPTRARSPFCTLFFFTTVGPVSCRKNKKQTEKNIRSKNDNGNDVAHDLNFGKIASIKKYIRLQKHIHITHTRALVLSSNSSHTIFTY